MFWHVCTWYALYGAVIIVWTCLIAMCTICPTLAVGYPHSVILSVSNKDLSWGNTLGLALYHTLTFNFWLTYFFLAEKVKSCENFQDTSLHRRRRLQTSFFPVCSLLFLWNFKFFQANLWDPRRIGGGESMIGISNKQIMWKCANHHCLIIVLFRIVLVVCTFC